MRVIADTSAWYAFFVSKDPFHKEAANFSSTKPFLMTSIIVFEELMALLHKRQGKKIAIKAGATLQNLPINELRSISADEYTEIFDLYQKLASYIDYVDASIIWLSQKLDLPIFTFDRHFKELKLQTVP